jgi:hypothetical protein
MFTTIYLYVIIDLLNFKWIVPYGTYETSCSTTKTIAAPTPSTTSVQYTTDTQCYTSKGLVCATSVNSPGCVCPNTILADYCNFNLIICLFNIQTKNLESFILQNNLFFWKINISILNSFFFNFEKLLNYLNYFLLKNSNQRRLPHNNVLEWHNVSIQSWIW